MGERTARRPGTQRGTGGDLDSELGLLLLKRDVVVGFEVVLLVGKAVDDTLGCVGACRFALCVRLGTLLRVCQHEGVQRVHVVVGGRRGRRVVRWRWRVQRRGRGSTLLP